jgi:CRP-like cAMP-binding protein
LSAIPNMRKALNRYIVLLGMQVSQTAACNRLHEIEQRLARWLLMAEDSAATSMLGITHDFLATMLGTDRPSVTLAAGLLQKAGLIEYGRGSVKIINRPRLEAFACECYSVIRDYSHRF